MRQHLKECSSEYSHKEQEIHPISHIDCEIIGEIISAIGKTGKEDLKNIIEEWKNLPDWQLLDMLLQWNLDNGQLKEQEQGSKNAKDFIMFEGISLDVNYIKSIGKANKYDYREGNFVFAILLNENVDVKTPYNNLEIKYPTQEKRDQEYIKIHEYLAESELIKFH